MNNNIIIVTNEEGKSLEINVLLIFELPEFRKKYVTYTMDSENDVDNTTMFISEINSTTNEIKHGMCQYKFQIIALKSLKWKIGFLMLRMGLFKGAHRLIHY